MGQHRFGEFLRRLMPLSQHDIEEILQEQASSNRRFGEIAMAMGLATPEQVWRAWLDQLEGRTDRVALTDIGVDAQAVRHLPANLAWSKRVVALRCLDDHLVVAVDAPPEASTRATIERSTGKRVRFVMTDPRHLHAALDRYYGPRDAFAA
jgi:hypothetical protein